MSSGTQSPSLIFSEVMQNSRDWEKVRPSDQPDPNLYKHRPRSFPEHVILLACDCIKLVFHMFSIAKIEIVSFYFVVLKLENYGRINPSHC